MPSVIGAFSWHDFHIPHIRGMPHSLKILLEKVTNFQLYLLLSVR